MALGTGLLGAGAEGRVQAAKQIAARPAAWRDSNVRPGSRTRRDIA
jgi:hypothetical protein